MKPSWKATDFEARKGCLILSVWPKNEGKFYFSVEFDKTREVIYQGGPFNTRKEAQDAADLATEPKP